MDGASALAVFVQNQKFAMQVIDIALMVIPTMLGGGALALLGSQAYRGTVSAIGELRNAIGFLIGLSTLGAKVGSVFYKEPPSSPSPPQTSEGNAAPSTQIHIPTQRQAEIITQTRTLNPKITSESTYKQILSEVKSEQNLIAEVSGGEIKAIYGPQGEIIRVVGGKGPAKIYT